MADNQLRRSARIVALVCCAIALHACTKSIEVSYPVVPSTLPLRATTTTIIGIDQTNISLPVLDRSSVPTSTLGFGVGVGSLSGVVTGPAGPVAGAKVRIERLVGTQSAVMIVAADEQGRYELDKSNFGRIRVRAWRAPDLAMLSDDVFFASRASKRDLVVKAFDRTDVGWAMAPATPRAGAKVNMVVQLSTRTVSDDGLVSVQPLSGIGISIFPQGVLVPTVVGERLTNAEGRAVFTLRCDAIGNSGLDVRLATGGQAIVSPPPCSAPIVVAVSPTNPPIDVATTVADTPSESTTIPQDPPPDQPLPTGFVPVPVSAVP